MERVPIDLLSYSDLVLKLRYWMKKISKTYQEAVCVFIILFLDLESEMMSGSVG